MASSNATGLLMPRSVTGTPGHVDPNLRIPEHQGRKEWPLSGLGSLGVPEGDTNALQGETPDDETVAPRVLGLIAIPHFPRGAAGNRNAAHQLGFITIIRSRYLMNNPKYVQVVYPGPEYSDEGPWETGEIWGEAVSYSEFDTPSSDGHGQAAAEAQAASTAHQVNQIMSDTETSSTGATGMWSIAGRV